ncbi:PucR family transcriptional regulator [Tsukamurella pseudospumae]|uniref:PucR family transcriptional regulator n=1 Tax=Tsukamurella pseudospumae TaxID=239498 RepID=A0A138AIJ0_9ACTN|nr:PucR family transcriptional regulator [Tsukamurella pseudospumae]KXP10341.1 PucR family transcriptional regulator [Tsukamurella pseudospumae]
MGHAGRREAAQSTGVSDAEIAQIREALIARMGEVTVAVVGSIRADIPFYGASDAVSDELITESVRDNLTYMVNALTASSFDTAPAAATGRSRAELGVPLAAVMHAYRIGVHRMWQEVMAVAEAQPGLSRQSLLSAAQHMWEAQDQFVDAMAGAHRDRTTEQALDDAAERAALAEHLLQGRIPSDQSLWEIATLLRLPTTGPYLAVAAATTEVGKQPLPGIVDRLRAIDVYSAWRLLPDQQIGIVHAPTVAVRTAVIDLLRRIATARVGVSAPFSELRDTPHGLNFARRELVGPGTGVSVFDGSVLGTAAIAAPETTVDLARAVLRRLYALPAEDRDPLFATFRAWVAHDGNVKDASAGLFVHPNTVRHRLRRIEQLTDRSINAPREVAELCLAFEVDARVRLQIDAPRDVTA